jgi:holo-[acyl-carrier protein] synthase
VPVKPDVAATGRLRPDRVRTVDSLLEAHGHESRAGSYAPPVSVSGVGIDLLEVDRLEQALERRPRLAERLFTDGEREYASTRARPVMHLAARFCAKEAVAKALGLTAWSFRDVEVVATGAAPEVRLSGSAAQRAAELGATVSVSLTHTATLAAAVAAVR